MEENPNPTLHNMDDPAYMNRNPMANGSDYVPNGNPRPYLNQTGSGHLPNGNPMAYANQQGSVANQAGKINISP